MKERRRRSEGKSTSETAARLFVAQQRWRERRGGGRWGQDAQSSSNRHQVSLGFERKFHARKFGFLVLCLEERWNTRILLQQTNVRYRCKWAPWSLKHKSGLYCTISTVREDYLLERSDLLKTNDDKMSKPIFCSTCSNVVIKLA